MGIPINDYLGHAEIKLILGYIQSNPYNYDPKDYREHIYLVSEPSWGANCVLCDGNELLSWIRYLGSRIQIGFIVNNKE